MINENKIPIISKKNEISILILYWLSYVFFDYLSIGFMRLDSGKSFFDKTELFTITMYIVQLITIFGIYFAISPKFLKNINWKSIVFALISSFTLFIVSRYLLEQVITNILFNKVNYFEGTTIGFYIYDNLHYGSFIVFSSLFLWTIIHLIKTLQQNNLIEQEKKEAEIKFLKAQINPHFLFNTLNNIYSLVSTNSTHSLKAIENLSSIMRFTTYETNKDKVEIKKEIDYINQYLALEQIRFGDKFFIEKQFEIENNSTLIHPYIISPFVENAIKHGVVKDAENPIKIRIKTNDNFLEIFVENKINPHQKDKENGIGLTNLKRRLNHYFGNQYQFEIKNNYETFTIYLKFPLNA